MENITTERIKEVMGNMTQTQFAESIHSSQPAVSKLLAGEQPSINILMEISKTYKVSIDWLLGSSSQKNLYGYIRYDEKPVTYADIISVLVMLMKNESFEYVRVKEDSEDDYNYQYTDDYTDKLLINDRFIGDVLSSVNALLKTNPEAVDKCVNTICEDYNMPLVKWTRSISGIYASNIHIMSPLNILKMYCEELEKRKGI